jgi:uncharacterized membrane protein
MMKTQSKLLLLLIVILLLGWLVPSVAMAQSDEEPVVRAVLFYSPTCGHCHKVINELIIPMTEEYGDKLQILGIDTMQESGGVFYQAAIDRFEIPDERRGVPTLIIGDVVLVGSGEIPARFPDLVEQHLADGGIAWPDVPVLVEAIESQPPPTEGDETETQPTEAAEVAAPVEENEQVEPSPSPMPEPTETPVPAVDEVSVQAIDTENVPEVSADAEAPPPDPVGMIVAAVVLIGMLSVLVWLAWRLFISKPALFKFDSGPVAQIAGWGIPVISLIGLGVSIYLAYVEINQVVAVCGPIGHCNLVQSSEYAKLFGLPIAVWGMLNYVTLIALWGVQRFLSGSAAALSLLGLVVLTIWSTLFSIYLTVLEIFVIQAVCMWCISSAIISTALMMLVLIPVTSSRSE